MPGNARGPHLQLSPSRAANWNGTSLSAEIQDSEQTDSALFRNRAFIRMVFIRIKARLARGSAAKTCTNEKSVGADRCFRADDEAIRTKTTIFDKPPWSKGRAKKPYVSAIPPEQKLNPGLRVAR